MKSKIAILFLLVSMSGFAQEVMHEDLTKVVHLEVKEISVSKGREKILSSNIQGIQSGGLLSSFGVNPMDQVGRVVAIARDIVAIGESIYSLVERNIPSNKTDYAPISVIPRDGDGAVDIFQTEGWSLPVKRTYRITCKNKFNKTVVDFSYSVIYSYRGSYNGTGSYLAGVQIVPVSIKTFFGTTFTANMKLGGIINQGTKLNPVAGATIILEYNLSSLLVTQTVAHTFFINGRGGFKKY